MMNFLDPLLSVNRSDRNMFQIIIWWEVRRLLYNAIVLVAGILSMVLMMYAASIHGEPKPGEDLFEPIMIPIFAILCNMGYTLGWLTEIFLTSSLNFGPKMFKRGLLFTLFWIVLPTAIWINIAVIDIIKKIF